MRLIFSCIDYPKPGGTENLIYEIIKSAREDCGVIAIVIGVSDSYVRRRLLIDKVEHIFLSYEQCQFFSFSETDLWVHTCNNEFLYHAKSFSGRAIIWSVLATSTVGWNRFNFERRITGKRTLGDFFTKLLIRRMSQKHALIGMDSSTTNAIQEFDGKIKNLGIIPIPVNMAKSRNHKSYTTSDNNKLTISYIGRSDDIWKIFPAKKILNDLCVCEQEFKLNIYTDSSEPFLKNFDEILNNNVVIEFFTNISGPDLQEHLASNSDIHFSMGMSALEGAVAGIATILVDPSFYDLPSSYRYKWLYETEGCSLGRFIGKEEMLFSGVAMKEIIRGCAKSDYLSTAARLCSEYVLKNHKPSGVAKRLINNQSVATNRDISLFTPAAWSLARILRSMKVLGNSD